MHIEIEHLVKSEIDEVVIQFKKAGRIVEKLIINKENLDRSTYIPLTRKPIPTTSL